MGLKHYILRDGEIVAATLLEWAEWFETEERIIEQTDIPCEGAMQRKMNPDREPGSLEKMTIKVVTNTVSVSTVFLGLDHNWGNGPPILFETMIFGGEHDDYQTRCATLVEAKKMHTRALWLARGAKEEENRSA